MRGSDTITGTSLLFNIGRRELWLLNKLARPGRNAVMIVQDDEGSQFFLNGQKIAYLHRNPLKPSVFMIPLPKEWVAELYQIDLEEIEVYGRTNN